jgi:uroporphyrinogen-III synthase
VYATGTDDDAVRSLLRRMAEGQIDIIAFTSSGQVERLFAVGPADLVRAALERTLVAAVGPVVTATLERHEIAVRFMPEDSFFMKPLASAMAGP